MKQLAPSQQFRGLHILAAVGLGLLLLAAALSWWPVGNTPALSLPPSKLYNRPQPEPPSEQALQWFVQGRSLRLQGDWPAALPYLQKSAEAGYWKAQNNLGSAYFEGYGVARDIPTGCSWTAASVAQHADFHNINNLLLCLQADESGNYRAATVTLSRQAQAGDAGAQWALANLLLAGKGGVKRNRSLGLYWLGQSALQDEEEPWRDFISCLPRAHCSGKHRNPALAHVLMRILDERDELTWQQRLHFALLKQRLYWSLSSAERTQSKDWYQQWRQLPYTKMVAAALKVAALDVMPTTD